MQAFVNRKLRYVTAASVSILSSCGGFSGIEPRGKGASLPLPSFCEAEQPVVVSDVVPMVLRILQSGCFVLMNDFKQIKFIKAPHNSGEDNPWYGGFVQVGGANHISINLGQRVATGAPHENLSGVTFDWGDMAQVPQDIRISNGTIVTPGSFSCGVCLLPYKSWQWSRSSADRTNTMYPLSLEDARPSFRVRPDFNKKREWDIQDWDYRTATNFVVENLRVESGGRGIAMSGSNNIVRNSVIDVGSETAIYMYGPGTVIEGNTIILHMNSKMKASLPAAIKLLDGHGAIIRNNRILVKGGLSGERFEWQKVEAAINLLNSTNVLIENNVVDDARVLVRKDAISTALIRGNVLRP